MFVPADVEMESWVEIEFEFVIKKRRYDLGLYKISEVEWIPKSAKSVSFTDFKNIYNSVRETARWMIAKGKYSKKQIIEEISQCYGLHPEYAEIFLKHIMDEFNAYEINGVVRGREL
jgi:hypothetical protein